MSQGPPPPASLFGYGPVGMPGLPDLTGINTNIPDQQIDVDGLPLLDNSMYGGFDPMAMTLDNPDMSTGFNPLSAAPSSNPQSALVGPDSGQRFPVSAAEDNGPGSGPLPVSTFGSQPGQSGGSTLTEFTKRRNWAAKVVEELKDFLQILDAHGRIKHVSPSITALTGYNMEDVLERFLKDFIHPDDNGVFVSELNESIATGNPLRLFYRLKKKDGSYAIFESVGHGHIAAAKFAPNPNNQSPFCQAVFMMSRPYPTKNASLLDSFLEHKIENERLKRRIAELRKEEADDADEAQRMWRQSQEGRSDTTMTEDAMVTPHNGGSSTYTHFNPTMPPPERPNALNASLTRENLEGSVAGGRPDTIRDKMARYEGSSHADTIEMLTGLRYQEGERSKGITTGNASPTLIKGDAGIAIPVDRDPRTGEKKKKLKVAEEYVCTDCGTLDSPEWRKGPSGPKTLCNACGLRWAKKEKKRNQGPGVNSAVPG